MLLTLKLSDWKLAGQISEYIDRIRGWGYKYVHARQLAHNRHEICIAAMRQRSMWRGPRKSTVQQRQTVNRSKPNGHSAASDPNLIN